MIFTGCQQWIIRFRILIWKRHLKNFPYIPSWPGSGYGLIAKTFSQEAGGMVYWLEELYILEEYRSKGLGSEYFRYMEEHKEEGVTRFRLEVEKENERAWKLYKRQGYDWLEYDQMIKEFC